MNIEKELKNIEESIGSEELLDKVLSAYVEEMKKELYDVEQEYRESKQALDSVLDVEQREALEAMEKSFMDNMRYGLKFGFKRGIFAGFQQFFVSESPKDAFNKFAHDELLIMPNMGKYPEYHNRRTEINHLSNKVMEGLDEEQQEHATTIYCTYDEKGFGVVRHAFYIGYRFALSIIEEVELLGVSSIIDKILSTEHELGFTMTRMERERVRYKSLE